MTGSQNWDKNEEEIVVEVHYYPQYNQVSVVANDQGIQYLIDTLEAVRRSQRSGYHYHLDKATNRIDGNVTDLVLQKK